MSHLVRMEIITASSKVPSLIKRLAQVGAVGVTTFQALGCGIQKGTFEGRAGQGPRRSCEG